MRHRRIKVNDDNEDHMNKLCLIKALIEIGT